MRQYGRPHEQGATIVPAMSGLDAPSDGLQIYGLLAQVRLTGYENDQLRNG